MNEDLDKKIKETIFIINISAFLTGLSIPISLIFNTNLTVMFFALHFIALFSFMESEKRLNLEKRIVELEKRLKK